MVLHYWQWLVLGIALCVAEMFLASFTILWFGLGAVVVALSLLLLPSLTLSAQLALWAAATAILALAWFRYFKPRLLDRTKAGISREAAVGQTGMVIQSATEHARGVVRFTVPLLGDGEWPFICEAQLNAGDRCRVVDVLGNTLLVERC